ncbi:L-lactate permease [Acetobacter sp. DmW_043]|uniref:lactate permease LctP family transporter n=1 Tax=Acetobacter sp. DmW_043 TaxID=1670658 RepID=UPI000A3D2785|nr:lactate permease LctP family transporter [Acetobacter sp. DmW_043]OUI87843.1 L-lactate permease [Acetobacter sp. DmW_043]
MAWQQIYDPVGNIWLSGLVALTPILFFFFALLVLKLKGHIACTITVGITLAIAILFYKMPALTAVSAGLYGFSYGLWPISWIIIGAVFLYKISVKTGHFDIIRHSISSVSEDHRIQVLLVAYSFGGFLEGAAGFGAPVAITTALLVGLGVPAITAGGLCLIANAAAGAFGAMGIPVIVGAQVIGAAPDAVSAHVGYLQMVIAFIIPIWLVAMSDGLRGLREIWPAIFVAGASFALLLGGTAVFIGPELPDIIAPLGTLIILPFFLRFWQPKHIFKFKNDTQAVTPAVTARACSMAEIARAWSPFVILTFCVALWSLKPVKRLFAAGGPLNWTTLTFNFLGLHDKVLKSPPLTDMPTPYHAVFHLDFISCVGTAIILSAIISVFVLRMKPAVAAETFFETISSLKISIYAIGMVLTFAFLANYSGLSTTLALVMARSGRAFTFFSPVLGWLGVFLTGSDTSSNALFGGLQAATGRQIGVTADILIAANTVGGAVGKMISPQSIAVASAAVGLTGQEGKLLGFTLKCSIILALLCGAATSLLVYIF